MTEKPKTERIIVVGMNRPRLNKIMTMVEEQEKKTSTPELEELLSIELIHCLAAMSSYDGEDGKKVRYMSNFVYHDGSPMTKFFDDMDIRSSIKSILMVGYEWQKDDNNHIRNYFNANDLSDVTLDYVKPNDGFDSLHSEMDFFKSLCESEKSKHLEEQTMGPGKMAKFVVDKSKEMKTAKLKERQEMEAAKKAEAEASTADIPEAKPAKILQIDPNRPRYACRMCRTILFGQEHLAKDHVQNLHSFKKANFNAKRPTVACQSIFCGDEVLEYLSVNGQDVEGKLACPKCSFKIGHWKWAGAQCSCGTWVTPAIQIPSSKVDAMLPASQAAVASSIINPTF